MKRAESGAPVYPVLIGTKVRTRRRFPPAGVVAILFIAASLCGAYFGS